MKTPTMICSKCDKPMPCIQRRDGSWACGPCLQKEWQATKRMVVGQAQGRAIGRELYRSKRAVKA